MRCHAGSTCTTIILIWELTREKSDLLICQYIWHNNSLYGKWWPQKFLGYFTDMPSALIKPVSLLLSIHVMITHSTESSGQRCSWDILLACPLLLLNLCSSHTICPPFSCFALFDNDKSHPTLFSDCLPTLYIRQCYNSLMSLQENNKGCQGDLSYPSARKVFLLRNNYLCLSILMHAYDFNLMNKLVLL